MTDTMHGLARRALAHQQAGTTDQADDILQLPVSMYTDPARYEREIQRVFRELPIAVCLSIELPAPGTFRAMTLMDVPVLLVRGDDGVVRAFLNICRHRGAQVCAEGAGKARVFACPYHAWVYDQKGMLTGRYGADTFGEIDTDRYGLVSLACAEAHGVVYAVLTPRREFDVTDWLGDFAPELGSLDLGHWHLFEQRDLPGPGWKVTMDGYLEAYHHNLVHAKTVGAVHGRQPARPRYLGPASAPDLRAQVVTGACPHTGIRMVTADTHSADPFMFSQPVGVRHSGGSLSGQSDLSR